MADIVEEVVYKTRGRKLGTRIQKPRNTERVLEVIRLRDEEQYSWQKIGDVIGTSRQAPFILYNRWKERIR